MIFCQIFLFLNLGTPEIMLIAFVALLLFGGKKLPELARGLGKGLRDFKEASDGLKTEIHNQINTIEEPIAATAKNIEDSAKNIEESAKSAATDNNVTQEVKPEYSENSYSETQYGETNYEGGYNEGGYDDGGYHDNVTAPEIPAPEIQSTPPVTAKVKTSRKKLKSQES